jgi:hypothetical protein
MTDRSTAEQGRRAARRSIGSAILSFVLLDWVSATGRWLLQRLTRDRVSLPRTGAAAIEHLPKAGALRIVWRLVGLLSYDVVYFALGLVVWLPVLTGALFAAVYLLGPLLPIQEWTS